MDQVIERSWWARNKKILILGSISVIILSLILWLATKEYIPDIDLDKLSTGVVEHGDFQEIVVANGSAEPKTTVLIDANEGGRVLEIKAEEGELVQAGDVLVVLSNETLLLEYMQRETQIVEQINNLRNIRINLRQNLRSTEDQENEFQKQLSLASEKFYIDSVLHASNGIANKGYNDSKTNYDFLKGKVKTLKKRKNEDLSYHDNQINRIDHSLFLMERNLEFIRLKMNEMSIKAPISGQLNSFDLEKGQMLQQQQSIGRIDVPGNFWIRALVDQHYLNRLNEGQGATIKYDGRTYRLIVSKVFSTVENGQIEMFLQFENEIPEDLRRGQNFQVFVEVSAEDKALKLPKGAFFQSSGGQFVYVVTPDGKSAIKQPVQLGRQNPKYYEVVGGLEKGQKVITSSYESFKKHERIELEQKN